MQETEKIRYKQLNTTKMRTLAKLFLAVAVGMFALSCVTDATEDLGVQVGGGQVTEISLSLDHLFLDTR